jgi:3-oxoadipate enol-lactonase
MIKHSVLTSPFRIQHSALVDVGSGPPLIVIPGVQGRWEWMRPAIVALQRRCRTITYTLSGDFGSGTSPDPSLGFDAFVQQLDEVFERAKLSRAALCGVSYGGLIALRYAATRPERVTALVFTSSPAPGWRPSRHQSRYANNPWLLTPLFMVAAPFRMWPEIVRAIPDRRRRVSFAIAQGMRVLLAPIVPSQLARRVHVVEAANFHGDCERVAAPALIVTGEEELDKVVPVSSTRRYQSLLRDTRYEQMTDTGHLGLITQPERFAGIVGGFVHAHYH